METARKRISEWVNLNDPTSFLNLSSLGLTELPEIPSNCQTLICYGNRLTKLPPLPNCRVLSCADNQLAELPPLPNCLRLYCDRNNLTALPDLPNCEELQCTNNQLTGFPSLPKCRTIICYFNDLRVLPELPSLERIYYWNGNRYLWVPERQSKEYHIKETPNYSKYATVIQRNFRKRRPTA
jgi:Leucine-rich repeat (LRR) protein